jgi:hypothetical protein
MRGGAFVVSLAGGQRTLPVSGSSLAWSSRGQLAVAGSGIESSSSSSGGGSVQTLAGAHKQESDRNPTWSSDGGPPAFAGCAETSDLSTCGV